VRGDEMRRGRKKILHPFGAIAKVELRVEETSPYTGVLRAGARVPGIMRQSTGGPEKVMGFVPGIGLKLFTSGGESADFQIMNSPGKQLLADGESPDYNFFTRPFSNEMVKSDDERGPAAIVAKIFSKVHPTPLRVSVDHIGRRAVDGTVEADPKSPKDIVIDPPAELTSAVNAYIAAHPGKDPRIALAHVTKDATAEQPVLLYRVRVGTATNFQKADAATRDRDFPVVATLVATSAFVPSKFGDSQLYFRHHRGCAPVQEGAKTAVSPSLCR
jgi:hypothetical protein